MMTIKKLNKVHYTYQDILNKITLDSYITHILYLVEASYTFNHLALLVAYGSLKAKMRHDVKMSIASIIKKKFIQQIKN